MRHGTNHQIAISERAWVVGMSYAIGKPVMNSSIFHDSVSDELLELHKAHSSEGQADLQRPRHRGDWNSGLSFDLKHINGNY